MISSLVLFFTLINGDWINFQLFVITMSIFTEQSCQYGKNNGLQTESITVEPNECCITYNVCILLLLIQNKLYNDFMLFMTVKSAKRENANENA